MNKNGEAYVQVSPFFLLRFLFQTKKTPDTPEVCRGFSFAWKHQASRDA